jgi:hypothetical protein
MRAGEERTLPKVPCAPSLALVSSTFPETTMAESATLTFNEATHKDLRGALPPVAVEFDVALTKESAK